MKRVLVLVEGQTEEAFVNQVLGPDLQRQGILLIPTILTTKATKSGKRFKGGVTSFQRLRRDLQRLLGDSDATVVTTMLDYYGLPQDFPGLDQLPSGDIYHRVEHLEQAVRENVGHPRFLPYLSVHEFEALVLVGAEELPKVLGSPKQRTSKEHVPLLESGRSPEEINDGETTHPSARLARSYPGYQKTFHGRLVTGRVGVGRLREACPHFDAWVRQLEKLAKPSIQSPPRPAE